MLKHRSLAAAARQLYCEHLRALLSCTRKQAGFAVFRERDGYHEPQRPAKPLFEGRVIVAGVGCKVLKFRVAVEEREFYAASMRASFRK
jgi:hypothetical protein